MGSAKHNTMKIRINSVIPNVLIMYSLRKRRVHPGMGMPQMG